MSLNFQLRRPAHAIAQFATTLRFFQPVSPSLFADITIRLRELAAAHNLPAPMNLQILQINIGPGGATPTSTPVNGLGFQRFAADGEIDAAIAADGGSITFSSNTYPGWGILYPQIIEVFSSLGQLYLQEMPLIRSVGLQYNNEFRGGNSSVSRASELFTKDSRWLAPFWANSSDMWHCHVGEFSDITENSKLLKQVNFDINKAVFSPDPFEVLYVKVALSVSRNYEISGRSPLLVTSEDLQDTIASHLNALHNAEKGMVKDVFDHRYLEIMNVV